MDVEYSRLTVDDFEELMAFLGRCFAEHGETDFASLLPKLYQPTREHMECHMVFKRDGKIIAAVGVYPMVLKLGEVPLRVAGVGAVSVHPDYRGAGLMRRLLTRVVNEIRNDYDLSWLAGQRQRYNFFGYEVSGCAWMFTLTRANLRHCFKEGADVHFAPLDAQLSASFLSDIQTWHDSQRIYVSRSPEAFVQICRSWRNQPYVALRKSRLIGYLIHDQAKAMVTEVVADSLPSFKSIVQAWVSGQENESTTFCMPPLPLEFTGELEKCSEAVTVTTSGNWQVFDWRRVVDAALKLKQQTTRMIGGQVVIEIDGQRLELVVEKEEAFCVHSKKTPRLHHDALTAIRLLFAPPFADGALDPLLQSWLPLPLYMPRADEV